MDLVQTTSFCFMFCIYFTWIIEVWSVFLSFDLYIDVEKLSVVVMGGGECIWIIMSAQVLFWPWILNLTRTWSWQLARRSYFDILKLCFLVQNDNDKVESSRFVSVSVIYPSQLRRLSKLGHNGHWLPVYSLKLTLF